MMSDMKTFTVRDLDREPSRVLKACDAEGQVRIRTRSGKAYTLCPEAPPTKAISWKEWVEERRRRTREIFGDQPTMTKKQLREFDRMIRSE